MTTDHTPDPLALVAAAYQDAAQAMSYAWDWNEAEKRIRARTPDDARAAYNAAMAQARAEGRREGLEEAAAFIEADKSEEPYGIDEIFACTAEQIRDLSDAPAPAVTVAEAARTISADPQVVRGLANWFGKSEAFVLEGLRALAEGGAGRG
ncbi:MAG: hypothetical protein Tp176DCM1853251_3 [Prokaryotic dsDNA virus sp.]|nr:MAG: hypothetical protein Tp176DCM1853251_3 [Prokaryotic dsDNA virus sp.]|tara:strand:- start:911 stop:1363 length:453 start_codon:yes stop_codon:yes gene_type:complete